MRKKIKRESKKKAQTRVDSARPCLILTSSLCSRRSKLRPKKDITVVSRGGVL